MVYFAAMVLPNLRSEPSFDQLLQGLKDLQIQPQAWDDSDNSQNEDSKAVSSYLTSIVSSDLSWLTDVGDSQRDVIWELASKRLAERCGRSGRSVLHFKAYSVEV